MEKNYFGFSSTSTSVLLIVTAIIFGFAGYWYGSRNPGGFALGPSPVNNILNIDQGSAKDRPGSVTNNPYSGLQEYKNDFIGLTFQFPIGYVVTDKWPGDITELIISGNTLQREADIFSGKIASESQFNISYYSNISSLENHDREINNLEDYIDIFSKEYINELGAIDEPRFNNPEKTTIGNQDGYKAEKDGYKLYFVNTSKGFYEIVFRPDQDLTEDAQNTILDNLKFS